MIRSCLAADSPKSRFRAKGSTVKVYPLNIGFRPYIGFRPCPRTRRSPRSSNMLNCAGGTSAMIRNSNKSSGSIITKNTVGVVFSATGRSVSQLADPWSPGGNGFPLRRQNDDPRNDSPIQRLSSPRTRRSDPNATAHHQSPTSALAWRALWRHGCSEVRVATEKSYVQIYDTVKLNGQSE
jgi:hypothetical protein